MLLNFQTFLCYFYTTCSSEFSGIVAAFVRVFRLFSFTQPTNFALNIFLDSRHAPFIFGVASGDPLTNRVMLWAKLGVGNTTIACSFNKWQIADYKQCLKVKRQGKAITEHERNFTVKVDATGLQGWRKKSLSA